MNGTLGCGAADPRAVLPMRRQHARMDPPPDLPCHYAVCMAEDIGEPLQKYIAASQGGLQQAYKWYGL